MVYYKSKGSFEQGKREQEYLVPDGVLLGGTYMKKKLGKKVLAIVLFVMTVVVIITMTGCTNQKAELEQAQKNEQIATEKLKVASQRIEELEESKENLDNELDALKKERRKLEREVTSLKQQVQQNNASNTENEGDGEEISESSTNKKLLSNVFYNNLEGLHWYISNEVPAYYDVGCTQVIPENSPDRELGSRQTYQIEPEKGDPVWIMLNNKGILVFVNPGNNSIPAVYSSPN